MIASSEANMRSEGIELSRGSEDELGPSDVRHLFSVKGCVAGGAEEAGTWRATLCRRPVSRNTAMTEHRPPGSTRRESGR